MKRVVIDGWDINKAMGEATLLGLTNENLRKFFLSEIEKRKK